MSETNVDAWIQHPTPGFWGHLMFGLFADGWAWTKRRKFRSK